MMIRILPFLLAITTQHQYHGFVQGENPSIFQWQERSPYTSAPPNTQMMISSGRHHPITFANETHGFVLGGTTIAAAGSVTDNNFYIYEEATDTWTIVPMNNPAFTPRSFGYGVVLNEWNHSKAYLGFGASLNTGELLNDFWEMDMITLQWKKLESCPGLGRRHPSMVPVYDGSSWQIHVGLGDGYDNDGFTNLKDYWSYDIARNQWTKLPNFPSTSRHHPFFFGFNDTSYVGLGHSNGLNIERDFFSYSTDSSEWNQEPDFESYEIDSDHSICPTLITTEARVAGTEFSIVLPLVGADENDNDTDGNDDTLRGSIGFVLSGDGGDHGYMKEGEFHAFYPSPLDNDVTWRHLPSHPGTSRWAPGSFVIRGTARAYFTSGLDRSTGFLYSDLWMIDLSPLFAEQSPNSNNEGLATGCDDLEEEAEEGEVYEWWNMEGIDFWSFLQTYFF